MDEIGIGNLYETTEPSNNLSGNEVEEMYIDDIASEVTNECALPEIPKTKFPKLSIESKCREMLKEIIDLTYNIYEGDKLQLLSDQLEDVLHTAHQLATKDSGLVIEDKST